MNPNTNRRIIAAAMVIGAPILFPDDLAQGKWSSMSLDIALFILGGALLVGDFMIWVKVRKQRSETTLAKALPQEKA